MQLPSQTVYVSRREHFNAAHQLYNAAWSPEKNQEVFGLCSNLHGHNFDLIITIKGEPNPETGFVIDLKKLSQLIRTAVVDKLDHKNLNVDVDFMRGRLPSCENLAIAIWDILAPAISPLCAGALHAIRLHETSNNYVEYFGP